MFVYIYISYSTLEALSDRIVLRTRLHERAQPDEGNASIFVVFSSLRLRL